LYHFENQLTQQSSTLRVLEAEEQNIAKLFQDARKKAKSLHDRAQSIVNLDKHPEVKEIFKNLPDTISDLEDEILAVRARADAIFLANPKILEDYERREREITELREKLDQAEQDQGEANVNINKLQALWLPKLEEFTEHINKSFQQYMSDIKCAGEVKLDQKEDYAQWGIEIYVKFRDNEPVCRLDSHVQSGGERSVATMLYLLSLQDLTDSPFRLVDEINQGMDPDNERMIFEQIVKTACKKGLPQYFLITPKLLTDLNYSSDVTVLCIYNGPWIPEGWNPLKLT